MKTVPFFICALCSVCISYYHSDKWIPRQSFGLWCYHSSHSLGVYLCPLLQNWIEAPAELKTLFVCTAIIKVTRYHLSGGGSGRGQGEMDGPFPECFANECTPKGFYDSQGSIPRPTLSCFCPPLFLLFCASIWATKTVVSIFKHSRTEYPHSHCSSRLVYLWGRGISLFSESPSVKGHKYCCDGGWD